MEKNENFKEQLRTQFKILIEANEKVKKQRYTIILFILILSYFTIVLSVLFSYSAFKNSTNIDTSTKEEVNSYYQTLVTTFQNDNNIVLDNISTGFELNNPKAFKITNEGNHEISFNIKISSVKTSLITTNNLSYTLIKNNDNSHTNILPTSDKEIASDIKIQPNQTLSYILKISFNGINDSSDINNYYHAKIIIEQNRNKSDLLE